jgi:hypothetical protein
LKNSLPSWKLTSRKSDEPGEARVRGEKSLHTRRMFLITFDLLFVTGSTCNF